MTDYLSLGCTPSDESCQQVGTHHYDPVIARREISIYIKQLYRKLNKRFYPHPILVTIKRKGFEHDFGTYHEACVFFDPNNPESVEQAYWLDNHLPSNWDSEALQEVGELP